MPGEINFLKNSAALHMRTAFQDHEEPDKKRHMIRLWLTAHKHSADGDAFVQQGIPTCRYATQPDAQTGFES